MLIAAVTTFAAFKGSSLFAEITGAPLGQGQQPPSFAVASIRPDDSKPDNSDNVFYNAWVAGVDLDGLLPLDDHESAGQSVLSSDFVGQVAKTFLLGRYARKRTPKAELHPALSRSEKVRLGLALSNLKGIDYERPLLSGGTFHYTEFADQITFSLDQVTDRPVRARTAELHRVKGA